MPSPTASCLTISRGCVLRLRRVTKKAPGDEKGAGRENFRPPAEILTALVEDAARTGFERNVAAGHPVIHLGRGDIEPHRPALPRVAKDRQLQAAGAGIGLGPRKTVTLEPDRGRSEQPKQGLALGPQRAGGDRDQRHRDVAEHRRRPVGIGRSQCRATRRTPVEMIPVEMIPVEMMPVEMTKAPALRSQPRHDLAQTGQASPLRRQHTPQTSSTGPRPLTAADPTVAGMRGDGAGDDPSIQRFQQLVKRATKIGHGRPQNHVWRRDFGPTYRVCLPCKRLPGENPGQQCAQPGSQRRRRPSLWPPVQARGRLWTPACTGATVKDAGIVRVTSGQIFTI